MHCPFLLRVVDTNDAETLCGRSPGSLLATACIGILSPSDPNDADANGGSQFVEGLYNMQNYAATTMGNRQLRLGLHLLEGQAESLLDVLLAQCLSPLVSVAPAAASAPTNLATDASWRMTGIEGDRRSACMLQIDLTLSREMARMAWPKWFKMACVLANCPSKTVCKRFWSASSRHYQSWWRCLVHQHAIPQLRQPL